MSATPSRFPRIAVVLGCLAMPGAVLAQTQDTPVAARSAPARQQPLEPGTESVGCPPSWLATFGGNSGVSGPVYAFTVFDDGSGPMLYAGGAFTTAGGAAANRIAKWNGSSWAALGSGMNGDVRALTVFDDGSGPALYAGGNFTTAGGAVANRIAKWDGSTWMPLGSGMNGTVGAFTVFDDGSGPALYAGGAFNSAGAVAVANRIAKWNGSSWAALGSGMNSLVNALTVFDDGSGPALYAGGNFTGAGGVTASRIAKWSGSSWAPLGSGIGGNWVLALTVFDDGSGPALHVGGNFTTAGGAAANSMAKWNGSSWAALGSGMNGDVRTLTVFNDGSGPALHAGGQFTTAGGAAANRVAQWNGSSWAPLGSGMNFDVYALTVFDDGSGPALYAGGIFTISPAGDKYIAKWACPCTGVISTYCTALITSNGCVPSMSATGVPSLANPAGFSVTGSNLEDNQNGLGFFGVTGQNSAPFFGGTLCVNPTLYRLPVRNSGGAGTCAGTMSYSFAEFLAQPSGGPLLVVGQVVNCQVWFRDPPAAQTAGLTNGLEFTVCL